MKEEVKKALQDLSEGLKDTADKLMSDPNMNPLDRQDLGISVGLTARAIEMAIRAEEAE